MGNACIFFAIRIMVRFFTLSNKIDYLKLAMNKNSGNVIISQIYPII